MNLLTKLILGVALCIGTVFFNLYTFVKIWALIAVPMGAQPIDMWKAYGVLMLVSHIITPMLYFYAKKSKDLQGSVDMLVKFSIESSTGFLINWLLAYWIFG